MKEPSDICKTIVSHVNSYNKVAIVGTIIIGLINYSYFLTHHVKAPDAIAIGDYHISGAWELSLGRFGINVIDRLRGGLVNENLLVLSSIFLLAIAAGLLVSVLNIHDYFVSFMIAALLITCPQLADTWMFIYCADVYSFSILLSILSVWLVKKKTSFSYILAVITLAISISLYQAYIGISVTLCVILVINDTFSETQFKRIFQTMIIYIFFILCGSIAYYVIEKGILAITGINQAAYKGAAEINIGAIIKQLPISIPNAYKDFYRFFLTDKILYNSYWNRKIIHILLFACFSAILIFLNTQIVSRQSKILVLILSIMLPLATNVMDIIAPATKVNLVTGMPLVCIYFLLFSFWNYLGTSSIYKMILKYCIAFLNIWLIVTFINSDNASFKCREAVYRHFYATHSNIITRAEALPGYNSDLKWFFNDIVRYRSDLTSMSNGFIANDNEVWDVYGGLEVTQKFYRQYYGKNISLCTREEYDKIVESSIFKSMPLFPDDGSIAIIDNIVVIKLNDFSFK